MAQVFTEARKEINRIHNKRSNTYLPFLLLELRALVIGGHEGGVLVQRGAAQGAVEDADRDQHEARAHLHQLGLVGLLVAAGAVGVGLVDLVDRHDQRHTRRTGVLDRFMNLHNVIMKGGVLTPTQVQEIQRIAGVLYNTAEGQQKKVEDYYTKLAADYNLDSSRIVRDMRGKTPSTSGWSIRPVK